LKTSEEKPVTVTCIKPMTLQIAGINLISGVCSGIHPVYKPYYIRRIRGVGANNIFLDETEEEWYDHINRDFDIGFID
jgi:hypothetical protein